MAEAMREKYTIVLERELKEQLHERSESTGISAAALAREALRQFLAHPTVHFTSVESEPREPAAVA